MNVPEGFRMPRGVGEVDALLHAIPYARLLGLSSAREGEDVILCMPYRDELVGNARLRAIHGGAIGALLEFAAIAQLMCVAELAAFPKIVTITAEYLRTAQPDQTTFARASVTRHGRRVANVRALAWQADPAKPIAAASTHFLLSV
ncbi:PaaI family thioesterase [Panacagrimonas sp.]|uniref:PaaI family thioesterase n=1 Tax=Panacagrimonas sp. TaxID=2480088 RepID=UPI003B51C266